jgi:hypothetical protein
VNAARIARVLSEDWGLWRTVTGNLALCCEHVAGYPLAVGEPETLQQRIDALAERIAAAPKSRAWRLRARVGERKRWYETPEEVAGGP